MEQTGCGMGRLKTQIVEIDVNDLIPADWNYKVEGTEEDVIKLANSIKEDSSAGVPAVREIKVDGVDKFEVIDGNHRLTAIKKLGWEKVPCENFGVISKAKAIIIARRRNHKWFEDDSLKYAELFVDVVLPEYDFDTLDNFMPETRVELEGYEKLLNFDWAQYEANEDDNLSEKNLKHISINVPEETFNLWLKWNERCNIILGYRFEAKCFELAVVEAMNIPEESLK